MSLAATEMQHLPGQLRYGGWLLVVAFVSPFVVLPFLSHTGAAELVVGVSYVLFYVPACVFLGMAAHKMNRSWVLYGALAAVAAFGGGLMSFMFLKYFRHSRAS